VCLGGTGNIEQNGAQVYMKKGSVILLPAVLGTCIFRPQGPVTLLETGIPESS
jgi:mannose-6-phosphate isomerase